MPYVACIQAPPDEMADANLKIGEQRIICTDEAGVEWHLTTDSQVGDWLRYQEAGGTVLAAEDPAAGSQAKSARKAKK
jgi:hypothetical protein